ncbi:MAG: MlaD family protein [Chloroflexota bacterium]
MARQASKSLSSPFLIGIFVIAGSLALIGSLIWLGANQFLKEQKYYVTYFDGSIEGLEKGSPVKFLGVTCGRVTDIEVAEDGKLIEIIMQIDKNIKITDSLRTKVEMAGLAGGKFMQLHIPTDSMMAKMYPQLTFKPPYPVIKSSPSGLDEMTIAAREVLNNLQQLKVQEINYEIISFLQHSTRFFESPELYTILDNLDKTSMHMRNVAAQADSSRMLDNVEAMTADLRYSAQDLRKASLRLNEQIDGMKLDEYISRIYMKYDTTMSAANTFMSRVGFRTESALFGLTETFEELKSTNKQLRKALRGLSENPSSIFFSQPPPKEGK